MRQPIPFGKYVLLERISVGGMAEVFKAKSFGVEGFEKILAIKRILPSLAEDSDFIEMFIDEAKICGQLNHANICQIFELGRVQDSHFIAMEFVWGKDLLQLQNRFRKTRQTMKPDMAAFVATKLCEGLDYAHKKKDATGKPLHIIHRDISPQNILVSYEGELKIIDFGIAKAASRSSKTQAGVLKGKFGYMSPEQVRGLPLDRRSDVFAIGTILYELLTADRVFVGQSDFETLEKVRNVDVPPPTKVNPSIPVALEKIILRALKKDVDDRYQWAAEMQEELQAFLMGFDPVFTAKQLSTWMRDQFSTDMRREQEVLDEQRKVGKEVLTAPIAQSFGAAVSMVSASPPMAAEYPVHPTRKLAGGDLELVDEDDPFGEQTTVSGMDFGDASPAPSSSPSSPAPYAASPYAPLPEQATAILSDQALAPRANPLRGQKLATGSDLPNESTVILGDTSGPKGPVSQPTSSPQARTMLEYPAPVIPSASGSSGGASSVVVAPQVTPVGTGQVVSPLPYAPAARSTLWKDILIGVGVAAALVGGVLGIRAYFGKGAPRGTLVVMASPAQAADVLIDGVQRGHLEAGKPLTVKDVPAGAHAVLVRAADGAEWKSSVALQPGDVSVVSAALVAPPSAGMASGTLKLNIATVGAQVWVDGAELADGAWQQPISLRADVPHEIRVTKPQREEVKLAVTLKAGEELKKEIELVPGYGKIAITTEPSGAEVNVNGKRAGVTPMTVADIDPGKPARVTVRAKGFATVTKYVSFDKGLDQALELRLVTAKGGEETGEGDPTGPAEKVAHAPKGTVLADVSLPDEKPRKPATKDKEKDDEFATVKTPVAAIPKNEKSEKTEPAKDTAKNATPSPGEMGFLVANTQPWAKVLIDGKDTGKTTPIAPRSKIPLKPGRHIVTFVANGKKFNFDIIIKAAEDTRLIKQLTDSGP